MSEDDLSNAQDTVDFIKRSYRVLSHRAMTMTAMILGAIISVYAAIDPSLYRLIVAAGFWILAYLPALWAETKSR